MSLNYLKEKKFIFLTQRGGVHNSLSRIEPKFFSRKIPQVVLYLTVPAA